MALASLACAALLASFGTSAAYVALPTLAQAFSAPFHRVQWVVLSYLLVLTTLIVGAGRLGDRFGPRRVLVAGLVVFAVAAVLGGVAPTLEVLIAARAAQGLGAASMMALAVGMVSDLVPKESTGRAMGLLGTMSAIGTALGPSLGGLLIAGLGWRALFLAPVPGALDALVLAYWHLPCDGPRPARAGGSFDLAGTLLLVVALGAYALTLTLGRGGSGLVQAGLLGVAVAAGGLFLAVEHRAKAPLIHVNLLRNGRLRGGLASTVLVSTVLMATLVVGPLHLSRSLKLNAASVGFGMMLGPVVAALAGMPAGRLVDRYGAARTSLGGVAGVLAGGIALAGAPTAWGVAGYIAAIVVLTAGYALFQAANNTAVMAESAPGQRGTIAGLLNLARNLGLITGASGMGAVFIAASGSADLATASPAGVASGMRATFVVGAGLAVIALVVVHRTARSRKAA